MDYSLLVGLDPDAGTVVVGMIDYIRKFDIAKRLESRVKNITGQEPTVVQPERYKDRLLASSARYFVSVPSAMPKGKLARTGS